MAKGRKTGGRKAGVPNVATANAREAIGRFLDDSAADALGWIREVYETQGPKAAFDCWVSLVEFGVPKLQRTDIGTNNGPLEAILKLGFVDGPGNSSVSK